MLSRSPFRVPLRTVLLGAFYQRCCPNFISQSLIRVSQRSSLFIMSLRSFALSGVMIMVNSDIESLVDLDLALEPARQHPPSVEPISLHCLQLGVRAPQAPPSRSSRMVSMHGWRQPSQAVVLPRNLAPEHSGTSRPLERTLRSFSCLDHADRCDCGDCLVLGILCSLVSLVSCSSGVVHWNVDRNQRSATMQRW